MGTWGVGAFDNDHAANFAALLDRASSAQRTELIREAMLAVTGANGETSSRRADPAVAAAAIVASQRPGAEMIRSAYAPEESISQLPPEMVSLAMSVLDKVTSADSKVRKLWAETPEFQGWLDDIASIKRDLLR